MPTSSPDQLRGPSDEPPSTAATRNRGLVLAFVSPKGGTGKTLISATATYLLSKAGKKVVAIDADFSTRGLSLYLMGSVLSADFDIQAENCIAEMVLHELPSKSIVPRRIIRDDVTMELILSNQSLWKGGVPDEDFLVNVAKNESDNNLSLERYHRCFVDLCDRLRNEYDYVIIDTRGGYDFTSAVPAILADRYFIVMEPDKVSVEQIQGFLSSVARFENMIRTKSRLSGFIVNKATFSPNDTAFSEGLVQRYEQKTIGVIPADYDCIRAYRTKEIPTQKYPYSDFSFYSFKTIDRMLNPSDNWNADKQDAWYRFFREIRSQWLGRVRLQQLREYAPLLQVALVAAAVACVWLYSFLQGAIYLQLMYVLGAVLVIWSLLGGFLALDKLLARVEIPRHWRLIVSGGSAAVASVLLVAVLITAINSLAPKALLDRIAAQDRVIADLTRTAFANRDYRTRLNFIMTDLVRAAEAQDRILIDINKTIQPLDTPQFSVAVNNVDQLLGQLKGTNAAVRSASATLGELADTVPPPKK